MKGVRVVSGAAADALIAVGRLLLLFVAWQLWWTDAGQPRPGVDGAPPQRGIRCDPAPARAIGAHGVAATSVEELGPLAAHALSADRPTVIHLAA